LGLDPDPKDKYKWGNEDHTINITGSKFYDFKPLKSEPPVLGAEGFSFL